MSFWYYKLATLPAAHGGHDKTYSRSRDYGSYLKTQRSETGRHQKKLKTDASKHAGQGLYLEHLWQNADDAEELVFLFRTTDIRHAKQLVEKVHTQARKNNSTANLPQKIFLEE